MDISTIAAEVQQRISDTQAIVTQLVSSSREYLANMQAALETQFLPNLNPSTTSDFRPSEQQSENKPPIQTGTLTGPALPAEPPKLVLHDYVADDVLDISKATSFGDIPTPSGDSKKNLSYGEDDGIRSIGIANEFLAAVKAQLSNAAFDAGYVPGIQSGLVSRAAYADQVIDRLSARLAAMGLPSPAAEMRQKVSYQMTDDRRAVAARHAEAKVENDKNMVDIAIRLAQALYAHADAVYTRALDVAKTTVEYGDAIYQLQIGIERSAIGIAKTAMETDFEVLDAEETVNKLNLHSYKENVKSFNDVADLAIKALENLNSAYEAKVSKYGLSTEKAKLLASFDISKANLSERALSERVSIAARNADNALAAFITVANEKRTATRVGESVFSEAIRGAMEARNTLLHIGSRDLTTG